MKFSLIRVSDGAVVHQGTTDDQGTGAMRVEVSITEFARTACWASNIADLLRYRLKYVLTDVSGMYGSAAEPRRIYAHKVVSAPRVGSAACGHFRVISPLVRLPRVVAGVFRLPQLHRS
jgi:hypothetical protein